MRTLTMRVAMALAAAVSACGAARALPEPAPGPSAPKMPPTPPPPIEQPVVVLPAAAIVTSAGEGAPLTFEAAAADGSWISYCRARDSDGDGKLSVTLGEDGRFQGDALERRLALAKSDLAIQEIAAVDPEGRYLVLRRDDKLVLFDTRTQSERELTNADARPDSRPNLQHRAVSFSPSGEKLAYLRRSAGRAEVVVHELSTHSETRIDPGNGEVWRVEIDPGGRFVVLRMLVDDTDQNGRLEWPSPERHAPLPCASPIPRFAAFQPRGDTPLVKVAALGAKTASHVPGFVATLGDKLVARDPSDRLFLQGLKGPRLELAGSDCSARILYVAGARRRMIAACTKKPGRPPLVLLGPGVKRPLKFDVASANDLNEPVSQRFLTLYAGRETVVYDFEKDAAQVLTPGDVVLATHTTTALIQRGQKLVLRDLVTRKETLVADAEVTPDNEPITSDAFVAIAGLVINIATRVVQGHFAGRPFALNHAGQVLIAAGGDPDGEKLGIGPLTWVSAQ